MRKYLFLLLVFFPVFAFAQSAATIDTALNQATQFMSGRLVQKSKVVVLNFTSEWPRLSDYIIEELIGNIVNEGKLTVVDRANLEVVRRELNFQLSGEVSDATAQSIGQMLGAQTIISGAITPIGNAYRLRVRAISVESAQILGQYNTDVAHDSRIASLTRTASAPPVIAGTSPSTSVPAPTTSFVGNTGEYNIGDRGPAGGIIFYDKGAYSNDWRYLEAAPADTEFKAEWGGRGENVNGTSTAVGSGRQNTQLIVNHLNAKKKPESNRAAQLCASLDFGGVNDWFLPSKDELNLMYKNLKEKELGGFTNDSYWSSSQNQKTDVFTQEFKKGGQPTRNKFDTYKVRAVRAF